MLVELHGGRIHLQSTQGAGTVFRFFIRVQRATTTLPPAQSELIEFPLRGVLSASSNGVDLHDDTLPPRKMRVLVVEVRQPGLITLATTSDASHTGQPDQPAVHQLNSYLITGTHLTCTVASS
jgi:hypothetical protein